MKPQAILLVLAVAIVLAGCDQAAQVIPTSTPRASGSAPCFMSATPPVTQATPSGLQATRPYDSALDLPAFSRCITNSTAVRSLYGAALALQSVQGTLYSCPKGFGVEYTLSFLHGTNLVCTMTLQADGCRFLYLSKTDVRQTFDDFQRSVAQTFGLPWLTPRIPLPSTPPTSGAA